MNNLNKLGIGIAIVAESIGVIFISIAMYYLMLYFTDTPIVFHPKPTLDVSALLVLGTGALLCASLLAGFNRATISRSTLRWLAWPGLIVGAIFFVMYLVSLVFMTMYGGI